MSICVFGIFVADICFFADSIPIAGQTILGDKYLIGPGGKGSNQAIAAARAGALESVFFEMGDIVYEDLVLMTKGLPPRLCRQAELETVKNLRSKPVDIN